MRGQHSGQFKEDTCHFYCQNESGDIVDPTASQYESGAIIPGSGKPVDLNKNLDAVINDPLFKTLPKKIKRKIMKKIDDNIIKSAAKMFAKFAEKPELLYTYRDNVGRLPIDVFEFGAFDEVFPKYRKAVREISGRLGYQPQQLHHFVGEVLRDNGKDLISEKEAIDAIFNDAVDRLSSWQHKAYDDFEKENSLWGKTKRILNKKIF